MLKRTKMTLFAALVVVLGTAGAQAPGNGKVTAALIDVQRTGFEPGAVTHDAGLVLFAVRNRSPLPRLTLQLKDDQGKSVHDFATEDGRVKWQDAVTLSPGKYTLVEAKTGWVCKVTIK